jgi:predicted transcriptional regulator
MFRMRETLSTRLDAHLLRKLRALAKHEGRQLQDLVEEALADLIDKHLPDKLAPQS